MKKMIALFLALLLFFGCVSSPATRDTPAPIIPESSSLEPVPSYVDGLIQEKASLLGLGTMDQEQAIRTAYDDVVTQNYFADPVGLDLWRYLSEETEPIPFLENRSLSPLLFQIASCEDFAAELVLLLNAVGLEAQYVAGFTLSVKQEYIDHAWVVVRWGNNWYHLDPQLEYNVTRGGNLTYRFFMKTDEEMLRDHRWGENLVAHWPEMPVLERKAILEQYTPPACNNPYSQLAPKAVQLPQRPDFLLIDQRIEQLKRDSGKQDLPPMLLNIDPPILVEKFHITPLLLPQYLDASLLAVPVKGYARSLLSTPQKEFYDTLCSKLETFSPTDYHPTQTLSDEQLHEVINAVLDDHPEFYWANITLQGNEIMIKIKGGLSAEELQQRNRELLVASAMLLLPEENASDFDKALLIYDTLATNAVYDYGYKITDSDNAYGAIVEDIAYCDGYARGFQFLANQAGLQNIYLRGQNIFGTPHAWNAVMLEGNWYYMDVTWGRSSNSYGGAYHDFFGMSLDEMLIDRRWDETQYSGLLPKSDSDQCNYFRYNGYVIDLGGNTDVHARLTDIAAICNSQLAKKANLDTDYTYSFTELKIVGTPEEYQRWKALYTKELFSILQAMQKDAEERVLPFSVSADTEVACYYNDHLQIISFYPKVKMK